ncbi:major facilitator superfamily domain-containing protein [Aspergillus unguis]
MTVSEESPLLNAPSGQSDTEAGTIRREKESSDVWVVWATFIGVLIASADESLMISTYSAIASQFHRLSEGSWLLLAYNFGYCISLPVYSVLGDTYGRKNVLLCSYGFFAISCLACGASQSISQLVLARVLAGSSGAGMVVVVSVILTDIIPGQEIALYRGYQNAVMVTGRSLGAPLGGILTDTIGWRWAFYGQLPIILLCILFAAYRLPSSLNETESEGLAEPVQPNRSPMRDLDFPGLIALSGTILAMLFLLENLGKQETDTLHSSLLGVAFLSGCIIFALIELWATKPLVPVRLFGQTIAAYWLIQAAMLAGRFALFSNLSVYFIRVEDTTDLVASLSLVVSALGVSVGGVVAGLVIKYTKHYKTMTILAGIASFITYLLIFLQWRHGFPKWHVAILFLGGFTTGILFPPLFVGMAAVAPEGMLHTCIGTYYICQQLGIIIGPAAGFAVSQKLFGQGMKRSLGGLEERDSIIRNILNEVRYAKSLPASLRETVKECYLKAFQSIPVFSLANTAVMILILFLLKEQDVRQ